MENIREVNLNGLHILLVADDTLVDPALLRRAHLAIRVCPDKLTNVVDSPGISAISGTRIKWPPVNAGDSK
ncbi:MAG: hypothetical protein WDO73_03150 [Ignavibacteriota bacterium]